MMGLEPSNPLTQPCHPLDVHRPYVHLYRLGHKWPPFRATVAHRAGEVVLRNKGHEMAIKTLWTSVALGIAATGYWIATYSIMPGMARGLSIPFATLAAILAVVGLWLRRYYEEVAIDWQAGRLRYRVRGWFRITDCELSAAQCQLRMHRVLLSRRRNFLDWRGYALCIWRGGELLFPVCVVKKREACYQMLEQMRGDFPSIEFSYGDEILSATDM